MFKKLDEVEKKFEQLAVDLQNPEVSQNQGLYRSMMQEYSDLEEIIGVYRTYKNHLKSLADNKELLATESDEDLRDLIKQEIPQLENGIEELSSQLTLLLLPKDPRDDKDVILEIRAGAGGDEAGLFAEELFRSYSIFSQSQGWKIQLLSTAEGNAGGFKEVIASISGDRVFSKLKFESGVHRVQRVPKTETQGRVHTSTITVAIIPEADEIDVKINPADVRVDTMRASGAGGQHINTTDSAVRLTHIPTGVVVSCQQERSQLKNKDKAFKILMSRLLDLEHQKMIDEASKDRLAQIGTGDRSERIRTYNFPQSRVTDHRIGFTTHALSGIMEGEMSIIIDPVIAHFQSEAIQRERDTK